MNPGSGMATIGGIDHKPEGIGTMQIKWKNNNEIAYQYNLEKALYFLNSTVNIISVTLLADQLDDDEGTFVTTK
eukprot:12217361-Ditylum_brightwellii.AAC.1